MQSTDSTLALHRSQPALDAFSVSFTLREDEQHIVSEWFPPPPARVLDLGVGNGRTTVAFKRMGYEVVGIEYCRELLAHGQALHPDVDMREGDARCLDLPDASFDAAIFSWNGIDYMKPVDERMKVLAEIRRCVRPGGIVFLSSHNVGGVLYRLLRPWFLTLQGLRFIWDQLAHWRSRGGWYFVWRDDSLGRPVFHSAPPVVQVPLLREAGLEPLAVRSVLRFREPASWWRDVHVNYVCRRPED